MTFASGACRQVAGGWLIRNRRLPHQTVAPLAEPRKTGAGKPADYDAILPMVRARRGGIFVRRAAEIFRGVVPRRGYDTPAHAARMTDSGDWVTREPSRQYSG
jgi:hypothetical protein